MPGEKGIPLKILLSALLVLMLWNVFLPAFKDLFNFVSPTYNVSNVDFYAYYRGGQAYLKVWILTMGPGTANYLSIHPLLSLFMLNWPG